MVVVEALLETLPIVGAPSCVHVVDVPTQVHANSHRVGRAQRG
jgi:hypothetical protein